MATAMEAANMDIQQSKCPYLPLEVWTRIISSITDCRYLPRVWLNCRRVSHSFKVATETAFVATHLPHTRIEFETGIAEVLWDVDGNEIWGGGGLVVKFGHLREDGERAVFVGDHAYEKNKSVQLSRGGTLYEKIISDWRDSLMELLEEPAYAINQPRHILFVRREVNDTELPELEVDFDNIEVSVLWKPMLSMLYGEAEYFKWAQKVQSQNEPEAQSCRAKAMGAQAQAGELSMDAFFKYAVRVVSEQAGDAQAEVRRQRLLRWHRKHGTLDDPDVALILEALEERPDLKNASSAMEWAEFDDEYEKGRSEKGKGNFYDGSGYTFLGKTETGPSVDHITDDEDDDEDDD
ncbi:hypothetical protein PG991_011689 [Apiospora marii]|uniref:F-box domain-containing protein n=1 Tax=Apiospora marii TaxID=335849 RepID=A0ABR1RG09_9PEZI